MTDKPSVLRDTDDDARRLARRLLHGGPHVALAVVDAETGFPFASRVLAATDSDGTPVILVSALSAHTKALTADSRCSLLAGEQGKGDPLAYPRVTILARAERVAVGDSARVRLRRRFVLRHPKAALYIDFPDFAFFRLAPVSASLNGGFGRAYALEGTDILGPRPDAEQFSEMEEEALASLLAADPEAAAGIARTLSLPASNDWRIAGLDAGGIDIASTDNTVGGRLEFPEPLQFTHSLISYMGQTGPTIR